MALIDYAVKCVLLHGQTLNCDEITINSGPERYLTNIEPTSIGSMYRVGWDCTHSKNDDPALGSCWYTFWDRFPNIKQRMVGAVTTFLLVSFVLYKNKLTITQIKDADPVLLLWWGSVRYSDRSIFRQVDIPTGRYSDKSIFRQVDIPTSRYSDRSLFRQVYILTGRYSDRSLFRQFLDVNCNGN